MNAREGMVRKLKVLEFLGMDSTLLKMYCPFLPEEDADEISYRYWWSDFLENVNKWNEWLDIDRINIINNIEDYKVSNRVLFLEFCSNQSDCPYCSANILRDCVC